MALGDIFRITVQGRIANQLTVNVFHLRESVASNSPDVPLSIKQILNNEVSAPLGAIRVELLAFTSVKWQLTDYTVQLIRPSLVIPRLFPVPPVSGTHTGDALPSFCSGVISFRGAFAGRRNRGRNFIAGIAENSQADGVLDSTALTELNTLGLALKQQKSGLFTPPDPGRWDFIIFSRRADQLGLPNFTNVTTSIARDVIGTTRSRKIGVGV